MPHFLRLTALPLILAAAVALSACKSDEEKGEDYFASGQALLAAGDEDRALVEFRNVFKYAPFHFEARKTYADILAKRGEVEEAYSQYLRLIEQYPDTPEVRRVLAEMAIAASNWDEAERHGREAIRLAPDQPEVKVIALALDYRKASLDKDDAARARVAAAAERALADLPDSNIARGIVIDHLAMGPEPMKALPFVEEALARQPASLEYQMMKYLLLSQSGDAAAAGAQLKTMSGLFPENQEVRSSLIRWYMSQEDYDGAEAFLRQIAGDPTGPVDAHFGLLQFLRVNKGDEATRAELEALIAANGENENAQLYKAMIASMDFDAGKRDEAIAAMRAIIEKAQPSNQTSQIKGMLARSLDQIGDRQGASALVEEILAVDHTHAVALKLRAGWALAADDTPRAIQDLNTALTNAPRDPEVFNLLALAQQRDGNLDSMGEYLAQAYQASGRAPQEALRYAGFQAGQGDMRQAETTLTEAWLVSPGNIDILRTLADMFVSERKWAQAQVALDYLKKLEAPGLSQLEAVVLEGQGKGDEAIAMLKGLIEKNESVAANTQAALNILLARGDRDGARALMQEVLARAPGDRDLRLLSAGLKVQAGDVAGAIADYQALITEDPKEEPPYRLLYGVLSQQGRAADATAVLEAGLAARPEASTLIWLKAGELERDGKIDEAIAAYERLYASDASDVLVANNLASLLATHRSGDAASLARAEAISRRLRGQDTPAFQDTYGWIAFLTGNTYGAIAHLEPAAKGLPDDALTQYHLGKLYQSMDRAVDAVAQYDKALALAAKSPVLASLPQIRDAQDQRNALQAELDKAKSP